MMRVRLVPNDIVACHELPARRNEKMEPIILNFAEQTDDMMQKKNVKGSTMFVNVHLTKKHGYAGQLKNARELRSSALSQGCYVKTKTFVHIIWRVVNIHIFGKLRPF